MFVIFCHTVNEFAKKTNLLLKFLSGLAHNKYICNQFINLLCEISH